ncbi:hypothetical protein JIQ42_04191 [Leishmania sp. Namibia]|uniref:hypothetical protein n=1 Tax=Leishmania sp. Namibia TaxID=2802991 RepID=UPI001B5DD8A4|nr:hypothetical protein JIQ42_04191 [Leishmania sp. Namibia]
MRRPHVLTPFLSLPTRREPCVGGGPSQRNQPRPAAPPPLLRVPLSIPALRLPVALGVVQAAGNAASAPFVSVEVAALSRSSALRGGDEPRPPEVVQASSSLSFHSDSRAGEAAEEAALASTLFHLLQLRRWCASYPASTAGAYSPGVLTTPEQMPGGTLPLPPAKQPSEQEGDFVRLQSEVRALGDLLRAYRISHRPLPVPVPRTTPSIPNVDQSSAPRRESPKHRRAPAQLVTTPTDAEEAWLLPLQIDVVQCVLRRLQVMELVLKRWVTRGTSPRCDTLGRPAKALREEVTAFFMEEVLVAAELVALRGACERDAQSLTCLVHVLTAAADAGAAVSVAMLVEAAAVAAQPSQRGGDEDGGSVAVANWCSCVPWLLHCYSTVHLRTSPSLVEASARTPRESAASWLAASAWMTAAADRVCATQSSELLQLAPTPAEAWRTEAAAGSGTGISVQREAAARAHTFGPWQGVLDAEATYIAGAQGFTCGRDGGGDIGRAASEKWLRDWYAACDVTDAGGKSKSSSNGAWHPYWQLVVSEMVRSCAHAVDAIIELSETTNVHWRSHGPSPASPEAPRDCLLASSRSATATLEEMQFYAVGCYISLRRIASSLQRHCRLVPLLQLHAMVSGCVCRSGAVADTLLSQQREQRSHENDASRRSAGGIKGSLSMAVAAAQWRRRLLSGELLQPRSAAPASQDERRRHHRRERQPPTYLPQRYQAGAMLWREVALFDAYTLITIGHVSERAIDGAEVDKNAVLNRVAWLQQECAQHLTVLEASDGEVTGRAGTDSESAKPDGDADGPSAATKDRGASYTVSRVRRSLLLRWLTPRTRAGLIAKLQEGLRLSTKVLARWGTPEQICALYFRYPSMGASWEVGRSLLQCGQYSVAVQVLESLLEASATARGAPATYSSPASCHSPLLLSSGAIAVRQLLLEAVEGAAAALVQDSRWLVAARSSGVSPDAAITSTDASLGEAEVPLPAELRTRLHSLYAHLHSLPAPLPLCLHAVVRGLASVSSDAAASGLHDDTETALPSTACRQIKSKSGTSPLSTSSLSPPSLQPRTSPEERTRTTAVLCTYVLRCHLAENPQKGLLAKTVELWASCVVPYLGRRSRDGAEASPASPWTSLRLSLTDRYLRAVIARLLCGYPQLPIARLLLARLVQLASPMHSRASSETTGSQSTVSDDRALAESDARVALTVVWLLGELYKLVKAPAAGYSIISAEPYPRTNISVPTALAHRLCVPLTAPTPPVATTTTSAQGTEKGALTSRDTQPLVHCRAWNAGFTERYVLDTLRLMPRIALEALERLLRLLPRRCAGATATGATGSFITTEQRGATFFGRSISFYHDRVTLILQCRRAEEEEQRQPWQCSGCYLWNSRYARACKRCLALSTVLLQCRACMCLTSSADDREDHGLRCDVCGTLLIPPSSFQSREEVPKSPSSAAGPLPRASTIHASRANVPAQDLAIAADRRFTVDAAAATVTGTGRTASRFTASAAVARVVLLRQWSCTHCRTPNDPQHVFFCRGCGRAATDPEKREAVASATGEVSGASTGAAALTCDCCGYSPKSVEARMLPWCEQCGALRQRIRELCKPSTASCISSSTNLPSRSSACATGAIPPAAATEQHLAYLWWCVECTVALNPWTRTNCELCGAGRPAAAATIPRAARMATAPSLPSTLPSLPDLALLSEKYNAAAPFVAIPWLMQACPSCKAESRVGMFHCWQCHAPLTWSLEVRQAVSDGWWRWVTQVVRVVMNFSETGPQAEDETSSSSSAGADAPLHVPSATRWLCLHGGCLHVNCINVATAGVSGDSGATLAPPCHSCASCAFTPRRPVEVLSPFHDRFAWSDTAAQLSPTRAAVVVEALLLPPSAPLPGEITLRQTEPLSTISVVSKVSSTVRSADAATTAPQSNVRWLPRSCSTGATTTAFCASCGASMTSERAEVAVPSAPLPLRLRSLLLVNVCAACGWCAWGRSSCAYDIPATPRVGAGVDVRQQAPSSPPRQQSEEDASAHLPLLPGEHAMALRLLLKALAHAVQEGVALEVPPSKHAASTSIGIDSGGASAGTSSSTTVTVPSRKLDWAWLSRFVFSGVRLIASSVSEALPRRCDSGGASRALHHQQCLHERLPWRGCDLTSAQQACSAEPRVVVLESGGHDSGIVHSAIVDVRQVLDGVCTLSEHRVRDSLLSSRSPRRRHRGRGGHPRQHPESPPSLPLSLQDAWTRRLLLAALDLIDVVNASTVFDEIGFATLRRLCLLLRPHEREHIDTETKWAYLQDMKLSRSHLLHGCVRCERCLTTHGPELPCAPP